MSYEAGGRSVRPSDSHVFGFSGWGQNLCYLYWVFSWLRMLRTRGWQPLFLHSTAPRLEGQSLGDKSKKWDTSLSYSYTARCRINLDSLEYRLPEWQMLEKPSNLSSAALPAPFIYKESEGPGWHILPTSCRFPSFPIDAASLFLALNWQFLWNRTMSSSNIAATGSILI